MNNTKVLSIGSLLDSVIDNRGRNPSSYASEGYFVLDNYLIGSSRYPEASKVRRFISQDIHDSFLRKYLKEDDICITLVGNGIGSVCLVPSNQWVTVQNSIGLRANSVTDSKYLYYYLRLIKGAIGALDRGSSQPSILQGDLLSLNVNIIDDTTQQKRISGVLSTLDDKIELNNRMNTELERMIKTIYDYWFIQFDFPNAAGQPYKSSNGMMVYSDQLKREIPSGWKCENMLDSSLFDVIKPKVNYFDNEKRYIATADVAWLSMGDGSIITYENRESRANMQPREYSVWFAKMKESIKHIFVGDYSSDLLDGYIFSTGFMGLQATETSFEYIASVVHQPYFELVKDFNAHGATMAGIGNNDLKNIKLLVPDTKTLQKFHQITRPLFQQLDANRQESQNLAALRDWLLPMLMNGQVRVGR